MCGIAGVLNFDRQNNVDQELVHKLKDSIHHRGPDANGVFIEKNVGLAHTRLSIIDLNSGDQPMYSYDNQCVLVFNGEIYNYLELKDELVKLGHQFLTASDTEVILNSYLQWGTDCLNKFNGEWAIALWDKRDNSLFVSRDRYGIKPLYFWKENDRLTFSSEIKTFTTIGNFQLDADELWDLLVLGPKPGGKTYLKGIEELLPGTFMQISDGNVSIKEYYRLEDSLQNETSKVDFEEIESLLIDSVRKRLMSDVKIGTINSGGLDSSLVSKIACDYHEEQLNTFSVAPEKVKDEVLVGDESQYAEYLAEKIKSNHRTFRYSKTNYIQQIEERLFDNDGVLYHPNSIPLSYMFKKIKNEHNIKVVLGGEGADEVFRGYAINKVANLHRLVEHVPIVNGLFKKMITKKYPNLQNSFNTFKNSPFPPHLSFERNMQIDAGIANDLLGIKGKPSDDRLRLIDKMNGLNPQNQLILYEQKCYLSALLQRVDRSSMRWGIEARVPFLDHRLVNHMNSIKSSLKSGINEASQKKILKKIALKHIDPYIVNRKKYGFSSPIDTYQNELNHRIKEYMPDSSLAIDTFSSQSTFLVYNYMLLMKTFVS